MLTTVFAKPVRFFAKSAPRWRCFPELPLVMLAIGIVAAISGAFGTDHIAPLPRLAFWLLLMGWNAVKWTAWFTFWVRKQTHWWPAAFGGTVAINLPLPAEIASFLTLVGHPTLPASVKVWSFAALIALILLAGFAWVNGRRTPQSDVDDATPKLLAAGSSPERLLAVKAEDHYCRLFEKGGNQRLVYLSFGALLGELAQLDGAQVHRSAWVSDRGVESAVREGRAWHLVLPCGERLRVSDTYRAEAKRRGWLAR